MPQCTTIRHISLGFPLPFIGPLNSMRVHTIQNPCLVVMREMGRLGMGQDECVQIVKHPSSLPTAFPSPSELFDTYYCEIPDRRLSYPKLALTTNHSLYLQEQIRSPRPTHQSTLS